MNKQTGKGTLEVVNLKKQEIPPDTRYIYIGRRMPGWQAAPLGNPFRLKYENERAAILQKYRDWLEEQMKSDTPARREINRIVGLMKNPGPLLLLCWCKPKACHGDVVKELVEKLLEERD